MLKLFAALGFACIVTATAWSLGGFAAPARAQQEGQEDQDVARVDETIIREVNLVNVIFTVMDKKNRFIANLTKEDFVVTEDGVPQEVTNFSREADLPMMVGILIDTSNSVRMRLRFEQQAAIDFLHKTLRAKRDQAFVVSFDVEAALVQDLTHDLEDLSESIRSLQSGGVTRLYDAIYFASKEKLHLTPAPDPYVRRALIILSDGIDNQSDYSREEVLAMSQRAEVILYAISTNRTRMSNRGDKILKRLAGETGGLAFFPVNTDDLHRNFESIAKELRNQYSLAYVSTNRNRDGTFRQISIKARKKKLRVRARSGYFAPSGDVETGGESQ
ncbi:MAG: VWA domain-containing protein [Acidobacteria bacterium]|nr:VWA domain-containing protein [Acidobacteriota bacterium]